MPKSKRLTFRLDDELDKAITEMCETANCTKSELVEGLIRSAIDEDEPRSGPHLEAKKDPYDVYNSTTGCYSRYRGNGELMFHFKPTEIANGRQYYRDTLGDNPKRKWHRSQSGDWIQTVTASDIRFV